MSTRITPVTDATVAIAKARGGGSVGGGDWDKVGDGELETVARGVEEATGVAVTGTVD
jgi:hypothetical protein